MTTFRGFPADALTFYEELDANNNKAFWEEHKPRFADSVRAPMEALCSELGDYGDFHLFRPHNDLRFAKNKPPYKTQQGAYTEGEGGAGFYMVISAEGLTAGTGYYAMAKDQLERFRSAVDAEDTGPEIAEIADGLAARFQIGAVGQVKTAPRGYSVDHPRIELIRRKGLMMSHDFGAPKWLHTREVVKRVRALFEQGGEMNRWLDRHVGPSTIAPDGFFG